MAEKKSPPAKTKKAPQPSVHQAPADDAVELKMQRDTFVHTFFKKGAEFTEELLRENERLRKEMVDIEDQNAQLRTQLKSSKAMAELITKIQHLEKEREQLLTQVHEVEAVSTRFSNRYAEMEEELSTLANLYVASYQLHSTLRPKLVLQHLRELLAQLVGARAHAFYVANEAHTELLPVTSDGVSHERLPRIPLGASSPDVKNQAVTSAVERVYLTGIPLFNEDRLGKPSSAKPSDDAPVACLPMRIDDGVVGVIVIYSLLEQKEHFVAVDYELFKMLGAHAATALMGALLFANAEGKLPGFEAIQNLRAAG
jgi:GAF domain-containing protein